MASAAVSSRAISSSDASSRAACAGATASQPVTSAREAAMTARAATRTSSVLGDGTTAMSSSPSTAAIFASRACALSSTLPEGRHHRRYTRWIARAAVTN